MQLDKDFLEQKAKKYLSLILAKLLEQKTKRLISVDFGQAFVKILYLESSAEGLKLLSYDLKRTVSFVEDRPKIVEFITNFLKVNSILEKEVYLTISDPDSVVIRSLVLPTMPKEEVLKAAKWEFKDEIPFDLERALVDWQVAQEYTDEEGAEKNEIVFILAAAQTIDRYLSIVNDCQLNALGISSGPFNYANFFNYLKNEFKISALLDIGYRNSSLCIYKGKKLIFFRKLVFSGDKLTQALTTTLASDTGRLTLSYEKAEDIKRSFGIPLDQGPALQEGIQATQIISLMRPLLEKLVTELRHSFDYFSATFQEDLCGVLYLTGGGASLKNLDRYLNKELKLNVVKLSFLDFIDCRKVKQEKLIQEQDQLTSVLGALLAGARAINLLPHEIKTKKVELIERISLRIVAITVGLIFLFSLFAAKLQIHDYKARLKNAKAHLETISEIKVLTQKVHLKETCLEKLQKGNVPVDKMLKIISALTPNKLVLHELAFDKGRYNLVLRGVVQAADENGEIILTRFMEIMEKSALFQEVTLVSFRTMGPVQGFEVVCELAH